jgi:RHS repeat-associated protein
VPTYGYAGREPDASGLVQMRARYYAPGYGQFISRDPLGLAAGINPYAYAEGNPLGFNDPDGLLARRVGNAAAEYWGENKRALADFSRGFLGSDPLGPESPLAEQMGRWSRIAIDWGLIGFDIANTPFSPAPDAGLLGASGVAARTLAREAAEAGAAKGGAANIAAHEAYKDGLRAAMSKPAVSDPALARLIDPLYRPNATVGSGSTAAAIRQELATGQPVGGAFHSQKAADSIRSLERWLSNNPAARPGDRAAAENVIRDMSNALGGR